ncbi:trypsin-like peptidase domain-containing protein [Mucilaginibacter myungsuensis]|uniref:Trypsin-like peptidase domain-containing protein n=1 Tax=Mucilaginibacter myungsuensis TaxID=649104 RepID=A0A929KTJ7_9SPHI|nr:trypsin-like peptidase domain-containing protein [Mucilaginibacter myungsuensis]MBE9661284.1 trypsin-like peptidase domain-containing protein [Mucilaginibacter myungsuensis]MDN3597427.1 trypsin-like peptidase domain-containing protein [Mucilaginibacter myungsuensis]
MKKFGLTLLTACVGGAIAIGGYKAIESKYNDDLSFEDKQQVYFTNNPVSKNITGSAGDVDFTQAAASVTPAVVYIRTTYPMSQGGGGGGSEMLEQLFGGRMRRQPQQARQASGSGVIISPDGYIVTNNHVVEKAEKIQVTTNDHRVMEAKVIGRDPNTDLALIKVEGSNLPIVKLGNSDDVRVGEWVLAVGNPFNLTSTVTAGIVSAKGRGIGILNQQQDEEDYNPFQPSRNTPKQPQGNTAIESFIQTDAAINPGNSGGALVNTKGELIGINSAIASHTGSYEGYGFAVPVNLAKKVLNDIKQFGTVKRGYLGIGYYDLSDREQAQKAGITDKYIGLSVGNVAKGSGAEAAGIQSGDILTKIDGNVISAASDLTEHVGRMQPGDKVKLTATRNGVEKQFTVTLKENAGELTAAVGANADLFKKLGATFKPLTPAQKSQYKLQAGVIVTNITPGGILDDLEVAEGSVISGINRTMINSVEDIDRGLEAARRRGMVVISGIDPNGRAFTNTFGLSR